MYCRTPFDEETKFLEGFVHRRWVVSSHYRHGKENLSMKVAFFLRPRPLARLKLSFEEQLYGLFGLNILHLLMKADG